MIIKLINFVNQANSDVNITIEFGAHPQPKPQDVIWVIKDYKTIEVRNIILKCKFSIFQDNTTI